jgi:hypothetical protein
MPPRVEKHQNRLKRNWCFFIFKKSEPNGNNERIPLPAMAGLWGASILFALSSLVACTS